MIECPACSAAIPAAAVSASEAVPCETCRTLLRVEAFPALLTGLAARASRPAVAGGDEAGCFYHPESRAVVPCDGCGRYLCALCDLELEGRHLCLRCLERGSAGGAEATIGERILWDRIALSLSVLPLLIFYFTVVTAPLTLYICVRHWKTPGSLVQRNRFRFVLAFALGSLQIAGWLLLGFGIAAFLETG